LLPEFPAFARGWTSYFSAVARICRARRGGAVSPLRTPSCDTFRRKLGLAFYYRRDGHCRTELGPRLAVDHALFLALDFFISTSLWD